MGNVQRGIERCLWVVGLLALTVWVGVWLNARHQQAVANQELDHRLLDRDLEERSEQQVPTASIPAPPKLAPKLAEGELIGRIQIPRLRISTVVFEGTEDRVLRIGVGHLAGSPLPGQQGNVVLAAHRDTYFRDLRKIRMRDAIEVVTPSGTRRYRVDSLTIVTPDHTEVLGPGSEPTLTLVTCYPFDWFGHAPKRFIVRAREYRDDDEHSVQSSPPKSTPRVQTVRETAAVMTSVDYVTPVVASRPNQFVVRSRPVVEPAVHSTPAVETAAESTAATSDIVAAPKNNGSNAVVRGLKKINPRRLWSRLAGNE